jgi:hypothetical protein
LRGFVEHREAGLILLSFWGRLGADAKVRKANAALFAKYRERTTSVIAGGMRAGVFKQADAKALGALIVGIVIGLAGQIYFDAESIDAEAALEEAARCILMRLG